MRPDLALLVDEGLEVLLLAQDGLGDEVKVVDADGGQQGRSLGVRQPRDLGGLLKVCVLQVQTGLQGGHLPAGVPTSARREKNTRSAMGPVFNVEVRLHLDS